MMNKEKFMTLFKTYRISSAGFLVTVILVGFGYYRTSTAEELDTAIQDEQRNYSSLKQNTQNAAKLVEHISTIQANSDKIKLRIAPSDNYALNLKHFYKLESDAGITITNISKADDSKTNKQVKNSASFTINVEGQYHKVLKFITLAERSAYYGKMVAYNLSPGSRGDGEEVKAEQTSDAAICSLTVELYTGAQTK
jgi:hypothetical protein